MLKHQSPTGAVPAAIAFKRIGGGDSPSHRFTSSVACSECGEPSDAVVFSTGFFCLDHYQLVMDAELDKFGWASGRDRSRMPWLYWATSGAYRLTARIRKSAT